MGSISPASERFKRNARDTWTWLAMDADHKLVISWAIGPRDLGTAYGLMVDLAEWLVNRVQMTTDGLAAYVPAIEDVFGADVDSAQFVKLYGPGKDTDEGTTAARYSPPTCHGTRVVRVTGTPDPKHTATSYIERQNLTLRMANRGATRGSPTPSRSGWRTTSHTSPCTTRTTTSVGSTRRCG